MSVEKKNPYKFTIGFKKHLESHRRAADILNQTPDKADLITAAILNYYGEDAKEEMSNLDNLRPWIQDVIQREVLSAIKNMPSQGTQFENEEVRDDSKVIDLSDADDQELELDDEFGIDITDLMDSFRL